MRPTQGPCPASLPYSFGSGMPFCTRTCGEAVPQRGHPFWLLSEGGGRFVLSNVGKFAA
jgi:hypothetical protein